ncbi:MAG: S-adenosylmethionine:tRNA ribosyltransferase-isomerase [Dysgonamonadaceae bacterium]|jgi:S-adenosylmethionine:tRNA ribosyltransferase-isomerase|nr:S-adenosylmethionine:tRNA ribosyltransferase-isomerase [Dysgonamonadaceae bacterium]
MNLPQKIEIEQFNYNLPDEKIAKYPLKERDSSKLLVWKNGKIVEDSFQNINRFLPENALLVFNNTRVIQARLIFHKPSGAQIEVFCLEPQHPADYEQSFAQTESCTWLCLIGNAKRWKSGTLSLEIPDTQTTLTVECEGAINRVPVVQFSWDNPDMTFAEILERCGELPIPPYLNRKTEDSDRTDYQTVYSRIRGSVAAPTAGLHFTENVFNSLRIKNIDTEEITLHVGAGTFKPVKTATLEGHVMHSEWFSVNRRTIQKLIDSENRIFAVGTTSVRTVESLYYIGLQVAENPDISPEELLAGQWSPYDYKGNAQITSVLQILLDYLDRHFLSTLTAHTQILIAPNYDFKIVNGVITNFHQPKSTLLLLISAIVGGRWKEIYDYALANDFRFLSYGDSSLLLR